MAGRMRDSGPAAAGHQGPPLRIRRTVSPSGLQPAVHRTQRTFEHVHVAAALGVVVGVGEEAPFGMLACAADTFHQRFVAQAGRVLPQIGLLGEGRAKLPESPALDQRHCLQGFLAPRELRQQRAWRFTGPQLVTACLDVAVLS